MHQYLAHEKGFDILRSLKYHRGRRNVGPVYVFKSNCLIAVLSLGDHVLALPDESNRWVGCDDDSTVGIEYVGGHRTRVPNNLFHLHTQYKIALKCEINLITTVV